MREAGFSLRENQSGLWERPEKIGDATVPVEVDLLVPHQLAPVPNNKRRTELRPHNEWATKKVPGLEVAAVDRSVMTLRSLTPGDNREVDAYVAGPAALLVAKAFKLDERITEAEAKNRTDRLSNKDAGASTASWPSFPTKRQPRSFARFSPTPASVTLPPTVCSVCESCSAEPPPQAQNSPSKPLLKTFQNAESVLSLLSTSTH